MRGRFNVGQHERHVSANVMVTFDETVALADAEEAIKLAARNAIHRMRGVFAENAAEKLGSSS